MYTCGAQLLIAGALLLGAAGPVEAATEGQRTVLLENAHVRVTELFASPGAIGREERLPAGVLVSLSKSRFEVVEGDGQGRVVDYKQGQVAWSEGTDTRSWRLAAGEAHLILVEVKSAIAGALPPAVPLEADHSTIVDPEQHHLVFENAHVRIIDGMASAGATSAVHTHPPSVLVSLAKSRFRVTINGRTRVFDFEPAMVRWSNHFEHQWRILSGDARVIMVEIKSAHGDPEFARRNRTAGMGMGREQ